MYLSWSPKVGRRAPGRKELEGLCLQQVDLTPQRGHHSCLNSLVCWGPEATFELGEMEDVTQAPQYPGK